MTPEWRNACDRHQKKCKKQKKHPRSPAALQRSIVRWYATPGITGSESENEGVRRQEETKVR